MIVKVSQAYNVRMHLCFFQKVLCYQILFYTLQHKGNKPSVAKEIRTIRAQTLLQLHFPGLMNLFLAHGINFVLISMHFTHLVFPLSINHGDPLATFCLR